MAEKELKSLKLSSSFNEMEKLESFVNTLQEKTGFGEELHGNIMLSLSEAVTNAIVHGNKQDNSKKVDIQAYLDGNYLKISVKDEGEGFDPAELPNPLKDENLLREGGRGVYLIEQYADEVSYSEGGARVTIAFSI